MLVMEAEPMSMRTGILHEGSTDSIVIGFYFCIFIQCKESVEANSELFREADEVCWIKIHMKFGSANESVLP